MKLPPIVEPLTEFKMQCAMAGCRAKAAYRVKIPKRSDFPGNRYMTRYLCNDHRKEAIEHHKNQDAK